MAKKLYKHKTGKSVKYKTIHGGNFMEILDVMEHNMKEAFKKKKR